MFKTALRTAYASAAAVWVVFVVLRFQAVLSEFVALRQARLIQAARDAFKGSDGAPNRIADLVGQSPFTIGEVLMIAVVAVLPLVPLFFVEYRKRVTGRSEPPSR